MIERESYRFFFRGVGFRFLFESCLDLAEMNG